MRITHSCVMAMAGWKTFVTVCDAGSLSTAARLLGYSQSAVSRQVATLELEVGALLLDRLPRGVRPTAAGRALLPHARLVVGELGRAREAVRRSAAGDGGVLTLGAVPSATTDLVPRALRLLHEGTAHQRCLLRSGVSADLVERVLTGDLDLAVVTDYPPGLPKTPELERTTLVHDEMGVIVPGAHRLAGRRRRVRLAALADEVWAEDNPGSEQLLVQAAGRAGFEPRVELEAGDLLGKVGLVAAGLAVALVPGLLAPSLPTSIRLLTLVDPPTRAVYAVRRLDRAAPVTDDLVHALTEAAQTG